MLHTYLFGCFDNYVQLESEAKTIAVFGTQINWFTQNCTYLHLMPLLSAGQDRNIYMKIRKEKCVAVRNEKREGKTKIREWEGGVRERGREKWTSEKERKNQNMKND